MKIKRSQVRNAHRWLALTFGLWFCLVGLTGAVIVFHRSLDAALNPDFHRISDGDHYAAPSKWYEAARKAMPDGKVVLIAYPSTETAAVALVETANGTQELFIDPASGLLNGVRQFDALGLGRRHLLSTIYQFHSELLLGDIGLTLVGIGAIALFATSTLGLWLRWPNVGRWQFWFRRRITRPALKHELHKVVGLPASLGLMIVAASGATFAFPGVYGAIVSSLLGPVDAVEQVNLTQVPLAPITIDDASRRAKALFPAARADEILFLEDRQVEIILRQNGELRESHGATTVRFDLGNGQILGLQNGKAITPAAWAIEFPFVLHNGEVAGLVGRIGTFLLGLTPLLLGLTGFLIWRQGVRTRLRNKKNAHGHP
jgi:uncharacterized iron-regulated membrane protein